MTGGQNPTLVQSEGLTPATPLRTGLVHPEVLQFVGGDVSMTEHCVALLWPVYM